MIARLTPGDSPDGTYSLNYDATSFVVTKTPDSPNQNVVDPGDPLTFTNGSDKLYLWGKTEDAGNVALGLAAGNKGPSYFITEPAKAVVTEGRIIGAMYKIKGVDWQVVTGAGNFDITSGEKAKPGWAEKATDECKKFLDKIGGGLGTKVEKVTKGVLRANLAKTYIIEIKVSVVMDVTYSYTARDVPGGDWWTTGHFPWNWSYPSRTIEAADITLASQKVMLPIGDKASNTNILNALRDVSLEAIAQVAKNKTAFMDGLCRQSMMT